MKYLLLVFLLIYVLTKPQAPIEAIKETPPDKVETLSTHDISPTPAPTKNTGVASWYDRSACANRIYGVSCKTANGQIFDETKNTTACSSRFQLGDRLRICYLGKCIDTVCTDRGNFERLGRDFDLTSGAFGSLAPLNLGIIEVTYERLDK